MIIDSVIFHNEFDILELRLRIMGDYLDKIVIVESNTTFTGKPKEYNLEKEMDRFSPWKDKIQYFKVENPNVRDPWSNEDWQRDQLNLGWQDVGKDDIILMNDVDEILRPETLDFIKNTQYSYYSLMMPTSYFKFNYVDSVGHYSPWGKAIRGYKTFGSKMKVFNGLPNTEKITLHHGGWHFSWMGDEEFVKHKSLSFSHTELNNPHILDNINIDHHISQGKDHWRSDTTWKIVDLDEYFPKVILENRDYYKKYIVENSGVKVQDIYAHKILEEKK